MTEIQPAVAAVNRAKDRFTLDAGPALKTKTLRQSVQIKDTKSRIKFKDATVISSVSGFEENRRIDSPEAAIDR